MRKYRRMTYKDRVKLETLYNSKKFTVRALAALLGFAPSTICVELKHGYYNKLNSDYTETKRYSADRAQQHADFSITTKRPTLKIGNDYEFVNLVETLIIDKKKSPDEVTHIIRTQYPEIKTRVCTTTLYSYIAQGFFPRITVKNLFFEGKRKRKNKTAQTEKKTPHGRSIETRPEEISAREEFGHWEMDTVIGTKRKGETLIVLTERKTRYEIIIRSKDKSALSTAQVLNYLEKKYKKSFQKIFKTITVDNGTEFSTTEILEKSCRLKNATRTTFYYCHPYTSSERGSNENQNRFVRKFFPRGTPIKNYTDQYIQATQDYINNKYRKLLNYHTSAELFAAELMNLNIL